MTLIFPGQPPFVSVDSAVPLGMVASVEVTTETQTGVTTVVNITNMSFTFILVSGRNYMIYGTAQMLDDGGGSSARLWYTLDGGTTDERLDRRPLTSGSVSHLKGFRRVTGSASTTFQLRASSDNGIDLQVSATVPQLMYLVDMGNQSV